MIALDLTVHHSTLEFLFWILSKFISVFVQKLLVLRHQPIRDEHQSQVCGRILCTVIEVVVKMPLKMVLVEPAALYLDQQVTREGIAEQHIGTSAVDHLQPRPYQATRNEAQSSKNHAGIG